MEWCLWRSFYMVDDAGLLLVGLKPSNSRPYK